MKKILLLNLSLLILTVTGCEQPPQARHYVEITVKSDKEDPHAHLGRAMMALPPMQQTDDPALQEALNRSIADVPISWETPAVWRESPGSGMRLATFNSMDEDPVTVTIVSLEGEAGSLEENVTRWMRQINLTPDGGAFTEFTNNIQMQTNDHGLNFHLIDLSLLQEKSGLEDMSMQSVIIRLDHAAIFLKMTGSLKSVRKHAGAFYQFALSIKLNNA